MDVIAVGMTGLPVALTGIAVSTYCALRELIDRLSARREIAQAQELAVIENDLRETLIEVSRKVHYRHNLHCPRCGRFAKAVPDAPGVTDCKHHGMWLRTPEGPVEFIVQAAPPVVLLGIDSAVSMETPDLVIEPPAREFDELDTGVIILPPVTMCLACEGTGEVVVVTGAFSEEWVECNECEGTGEKQ